MESVPLKTSPSRSQPGQTGDCPGTLELAAILRDLKPRLLEPLYLFAQTDTAPDLDWPGLVMAFREAEGWTTIIEQAPCDRLGLAGCFPSRMISLGANSALAAVGLTALLASRLADNGISANVVAGYSHDHFFVPEAQATDALRVLTDIEAEACRECGTAPRER